MGLLGISNPWDSWLGDCPVITSYLYTKSNSSPAWILARGFDTFLRAVGQPAFVNNPLLGLLIWISLLLYQPPVGLACLLGGGLATITESLFHLHPVHLVSNGVAAFNGVLVGTVTSILYPAVYNTERDVIMWAAVCIGSVASVYFASAFNNLFSKCNLPYMALPFNLLAVMTFLTIQPPNFEKVIATTEDLPNFNITTMKEKLNLTIEYNITSPHGNEEVYLSWLMFGRGIVVSMGQVYAVDDVQASSLIWMAVLLSSPLLFLFCGVGAVLGSLMSLTFLKTQEYTMIYSGLWGYNSLLSLAATSCVFFPLSPSSVVAGLVNVAVTVAAQQGLRVNMDQNSVPFFTLPMTLCTLIILLASQEKEGNSGPQLRRCEEMSYPEKQAFQAWRKKDKCINQEMGCPAEKQPVLQIL